MWAVDPRRFTDFTSELDYCVAKGMEVYGHEYAMHFPHHVWPAGRDRIKSPIHDKLLDMGGQLGPYNGWERANYFASDNDDVSEEATQTWLRKGPWFERVKDECEMVASSCGVLAISGFSRLNCHGKWVQISFIVICWMGILLPTPVRGAGSVAFTQKARTTLQEPQTFPSLPMADSQDI